MAFVESEEFIYKVSQNEWEEPGTLVTIAQELQKLVDDPKWSWARNMSCKYVDVRIDMRDGGFVLRIREPREEPKRVSLDAIKWQIGDK